MFPFQRSQPWEHQICATKGIKIIWNSVSINGASDVEASSGMWRVFFQRDWNTNIARHQWQEKKLTPRNNMRIFLFVCSSSSSFSFCLCSPYRRWETGKLHRLGGEACVVLRVMFLCVRWPLRVLRGEHALWSSSLLMLLSPCDTSVWGKSKSSSHRLSLFVFEGYKNLFFISVCAPPQSRNLWGFHLQNPPSKKV